MVKLSLMTINIIVYFPPSRHWCIPETYEFKAFIDRYTVLALRYMHDSKGDILVNDSMAPLQMISGILPIQWQCPYTTNCQRT